MHLQPSIPLGPASPPPPPVTLANPTSVFFRPFPTRWGDVPTVEEDPGIAALERDAVTKPKPMTVEPAKLFQPASVRETTVGLKQERKPSGLFGPSKSEDIDAVAEDSRRSSSVVATRFDVHADPRIIHSLQLTQFSRKMIALLAELPPQTEVKPATALSESSAGVKRKLSSSSPSTSALSLSKCPPLPPPLPPLPPALEKANAAVFKMEKPFSPFRPPPAEETLTPFAAGRWSVGSAAASAPPPSISHSTCRQLLKKSVIVLTAHAGFDSASDGAAEVLTDLLGAYLRQLTTNLSDARDAEATSGGCDFPDILEKVLTESGAGSPRSLVCFYAKDVVARHKSLRRQCDALQNQYLTLTSSGEAATEAAAVETKTEGGGSGGDSKDWFASGGSSGGANARVATVDEKFDAAAVVKFELNSKKRIQATTLTATQTITPGLAADRTHAIAPGLPAGRTHTIMPGLATSADPTDYDADDDDVRTEPSSVKSIFENDENGVAVDDLVASTLIAIASPNSAKNNGASVGAKKKKKSK